MHKRLEQSGRSGEAGFGTFAIVDVLHDGDTVGRRAGRVPDKGQGHVHPQPDVVAALPARLHGKRGTSSGEQLG